MANQRKTGEREQQVAPKTLFSVDESLRLPALMPPVSYPLETLVPQVRQQTPAVGQRATRPDARLHGLGQTRYIDDLSIAGMLHAKIKRAGVASARIKSRTRRQHTRHSKPADLKFQTQPFKKDLPR